MNDDYRERLVKAIEFLNEKYHSYENEANSGHPDSIRAANVQRRIYGKIQGVSLALSYYDEMSRNDN